MDTTAISDRDEGAAVKTRAGTRTGLCSVNSGDGDGCAAVVIGADVSGELVEIGVFVFEDG